MNNNLDSVPESPVIKVPRNCIIQGFCRYGTAGLALACLSAGIYKLVQGEYLVGVGLILGATVSTGLCYCAMSSYADAWFQRRVVSPCCDVCCIVSQKSPSTKHLLHSPPV